MASRARSSSYIAAATSLVLHAGLAGGAYVLSFGDYDMLPSDPYIVIDIEVDRISEVTNIAGRVEPPEQELEPEIPPEETEPETTETDPEPEPPAPEPEPEPIVDPEDVPLPDQQPSADEPTPAQEPSIDDLFKDLERDLKPSEDRPERLTPRAQPLEDQNPRTQQRAVGAGTDSAARLVDLIKTRIDRNNCWRSTKDLPDWEDLDVSIRFRLDRRGELMGEPRRIRPRTIPAYDRYHRTASDRAIKAIKDCAPYNLPPQDVALWANVDITLNFDEQF